MASITLSDNVLNATETATVTFTFDADYALLPEKITVTGGTLSTPRPLPLRCRLCPFARKDPRPGRPAAPPRPLPRRTAPRLASHIHTRHSGHRAHRLHDHRKQQCRGGARTE